MVALVSLSLTVHFSFTNALLAMKIEQKKLSNRHTFTFGADSLNFAYCDKSGSGDFDLRYTEFPLKSSIRIEQNLWLRNVGFLWCALGAIQIGLTIAAAKPLAGVGFWLVLGLGCLLWAHLTKITYTVFTSERGSVWVIQDKKTHDHIIEETRTRRKNQLLAMYGEIDLENDIDKEVGKFRWLAEQRALTAEEAERRIAQVQAALGATRLEPSTTIN